MANGQVKHDYHLVEPSPWPIVGSIGAFIMAIGGVAYMNVNGLFGYHGPAIFFVGLAVVLYVMMSWWRDVITEAEVRHDHTPVVQLSLRYGMLLFIASEVMFFVGWFWAYFNAFLFVDVTKEATRFDVTGGVWPPVGIEAFDPWHLPLMNTLILLTSGTTVTWAHHALQQDDRKGAIQGLWLTVLLGLAFTSVQAYEYSHAAFSFSGSIYGSTFFMATGFHGFHVIIGTIFLAVCLGRLYAGHFTPTHHFGFEAAAWYWHFVDVVWLFLFFCIYVWGGPDVAAAH